MTIWKIFNTHNFTSFSCSLIVNAKDKNNTIICRKYNKKVSLLYSIHKTFDVTLAIY